MRDSHRAIVMYVVAAPEHEGREWHARRVAAARRHQPTGFGYCLACRITRWEHCYIVIGFAEEAEVDLS